MRSVGSSIGWLRVRSLPDSLSEHRPAHPVPFCGADTFSIQRADGRAVHRNADAVHRSNPTSVPYQTALLRVLAVSTQSTLVSTLGNLFGYSGYPPTLPAYRTRQPYPTSLPAYAATQPGVPSATPMQRSREAVPSATPTQRSREAVPSATPMQRSREPGIKHATDTMMRRVPCRLRDQH